jgi:hypothetical protein
MPRLRTALVTPTLAVMTALLPHVLGAQAVAGAPAAVDLTGTWRITVVTDAAGTGTPTVTLKQTGDSLTGHYSSQLLGEADVAGTVKEGKVTFRFAAQGVAVVYSGTVESKDALKGTATFGDVATGTFTAKRQ